jgi:hypothetical protein
MSDQRYPERVLTRHSSTDGWRVGPQHLLARGVHIFVR